MDDIVAKIRERVGQLEVFFKDNAYAMPNDYALRHVKFLCNSLCLGDPYIAEKAGEIAYLAERFYSVRKHNSYPGGADGIYNKIVHSLVGRIRTRADNIEYALNNPGDA